MSDGLSPLLSSLVTLFDLCRVCIPGASVLRNHSVKFKIQSLAWFFILNGVCSCPVAITVIQPLVIRWFQFNSRNIAVQHEEIVAGESRIAWSVSKHQPISGGIHHSVGYYTAGNYQQRFISRILVIFCFITSVSSVMSIYIRLVLASVSVIEWHHVVTNDYDCKLFRNMLLQEKRGFTSKQHSLRSVFHAVSVTRLMSLYLHCYSTLWFKKTRQLWRTITATQFSRF